MKDKKQGKITTALKNSPINYFSDLFVVAMVIVWIFEITYMTVVATIVSFKFEDTSLWSSITELVSIPLTAGGAIWMIKNCVQHAIAYSKGKTANMDFPAVNAEGEDDGLEKSYEPENEEDSE